MAYLLLQFETAPCNGLDLSKKNIDPNKMGHNLERSFLTHEIHFPVKACRWAASSKKLMDVLREPLIFVYRQPHGHAFRVEHCSR